MAQPSIELVQAFRTVAAKLEKGANYQWGHMGCCNCGQVAQVLTPYTKAEIHEFAMQKKGDWSEQLSDYCQGSGYPMDMLITDLLGKGLTQEDLKNLEWLTDVRILSRIRRKLCHNDRQDVIDYLKKWSDLMEEELIENVQINISMLQSQISVMSD